MDQKPKLTPIERTKLWKQNNPEKLAEQKRRYYYKKKMMKGHCREEVIDIIGHHPLENPE